MKRTEIPAVKVWGFVDRTDKLTGASWGCKVEKSDLPCILRTAAPKPTDSGREG